MDLSEHEREKIERLRRAMYSRSLSDKIKDRPRRELGTHEPIVGDDFIHKGEELPKSTVAPRMIGTARTILWWILGIAIVFFIGTVAFFAYYFTLGGGSGSASAANIGISVSGPPQVASGEPTEFQIVVVNRNNAPIQLADLVITYPQGTRSITNQLNPNTYTCSTPEGTTDTSYNFPQQRICLGTIEAGGQRQGTVSAILNGQEGSGADVKVELEYRIGGSSAIFVASSDYNLLFSSSPLSIAIDGNTETISGQPVQLTVSVASNANNPVKDALLSAQYPFGFKFSSASPAPSADGLWHLGDLLPGQKNTVTIQGSLSGAEGDDRVFHFSAGTRTSATSTAIDNSLADNTFQIAISKPFLGLAISANGVSGSGVVVSPGDSVTVSVAWQNNLPTAITDAVIVARLSGFAVDGTTVRASTGFYRSSDGVVLWNKTTNPALATIAPGAHGVVVFSFQIPSSDVLKTIANPRLDISVNAAGNRVSESGVPENLQAGADQKIAVASDLRLLAQGLYYSNPFGSTGPMPPKAGSESTYAMVFTITNTTNKISAATLTATLPAYVRYTGKCSPSTINCTSAQVLEFNSSANTVTWHIGDIAPNAGLNGTTPLQIAFEIGFTPSTSQIGQQPVLLQNIQLSGIDESKADAQRAANPGAIIVPALLKTAPDVTTNISSDSGFNASNATVVK